MPDGHQNHAQRQPRPPKPPRSDHPDYPDGRSPRLDHPDHDHPAQIRRPPRSPRSLRSNHPDRGLKTGLCYPDHLDHPDQPPLRMPVKTGPLDLQDAPRQPGITSTPRAHKATQQEESPPADISETPSMIFTFCKPHQDFAPSERPLQIGSK